MLAPLVARAGLDGLIDDVLSVDAVGIYKPAPEVYEHAVARLGVGADAIGFVSANGWDALGAKSYGFTVFWVNRAGAPLDRLDARPDHVIRSIGELPGLVPS
jgi:2-haloacid dehalogenase